MSKQIVVQSLEERMYHELRRKIRSIERAMSKGNNADKLIELWRDVENIAGTVTSR